MSQHKMIDPKTIAVDTAPPQVKVGVSPEAFGGPRPDLAGYRLQIPGQAPIYLVDPDGYIRWIPNPTTYNNLFRDWSGVVADIDLTEIAQRPALSNGACLAKGDASPAVYILDQGVKRWITSPPVMDKYYFSWGRVVVVPQILIDHIPPGAENWT